MDTKALFSQLGLPADQYSRGDWVSWSPVDGRELGRIQPHTESEINTIIANAHTAFLDWRQVPAPKRGELIRLFGQVLREHKQALGTLVSLECGKILSEGLGEVQEMIDICDFAVGLSRQLYGLTIASERAQHKMFEHWQPLGPTVIISAFNFPVAVWAWNAAIALICGNTIVWKPSEKTPLCALACERLLADALSRFAHAPANIAQIVLGDQTAGMQLVNDARIPLVSATGSCGMGRYVGQQVAARFGRSILELGGNNAVIVCPSADMDLALQGVVFGAVGTAGQRCTTTRRLFVHQSEYAPFVDSLMAAYDQITVGNPLADGVLVGPLIDHNAYQQMQQALAHANSQGAKIFGGERLLVHQYPDAYYVKPAIVEALQSGIDARQEIFAPIVTVYAYSDLTSAIAAQNNVEQGLSSAIFTNDIREAELFTSAIGSDCGIANVNIGTSGAEIGGAFGGEKATGGGRESGSDAWKGYMRRCTSTVNYSAELPLAQGIEFTLSP